MFSGYAKREWLTVIAIGAMLSLTFAVLGWWWPLLLILIATALLLTFFRDPERLIPTQRGAVVSPADGRVSSVHEVDHFEPFNGPAVCVRIFLSVANVHVNRSPSHGVVASITHKPGKHVNALNPQSAEDNESVLMVLVHPIQRHPIAAVRQIAGMLARTIVCAADVGQTLQRGQRFGIIKLGSTTELYLPVELSAQVLVKVGDAVKGGATVLANVNSLQRGSQLQPPAEPESPPPPAVSEVGTPSPS